MVASSHQKHRVKFLYDKRVERETKLERLSEALIINGVPLCSGHKLRAQVSTFDPVGPDQLVTPAGAALTNSSNAICSV